MPDKFKVEIPRALPPRVLVISFTDTTSEPRVMRQLKTFSESNVPFAVASFAPSGSHRGSTVFVNLREQGSSSHRNIGQRIIRLPLRALRLFLPFLRLFVGNGVLGYRISHLWFRQQWKEVDGFFVKVSDALRQCGFEPNVILFHDFFTWGLSQRLSSHLGARKILDSHEHAVSQYANSRIWKLFFAPMVRDVEEQVVRESDAVITVGEEIRQLLQEQYSSDTKIVVVRSVSELEVDEYRLTSWPIRLLYSGAICEGRGLENLVDAVSLLGPEFTLSIKGPVVNEKFANMLKKRVARSNRDSRISIEPPVPYRDIVRDAAKYDVGVFTQEATSLHKLNTLPNKFFAYVRAGLALCVSDFPEMGRLSRDFGFAVLVREPTVHAIAEALATLSPARVDSLKARSIEASKKLCWDTEQQVLIGLVEEVSTT